MITPTKELIKIVGCCLMLIIIVTAWVVIRISQSIFNKKGGLSGVS